MNSVAGAERRMILEVVIWGVLVVVGGGGFWFGVRVLSNIAATISQIM